jgi:hypothetical protein
MGVDPAEERPFPHVWSLQCAPPPPLTCAYTPMDHHVIRCPSLAIPLNLAGCRLPLVGSLKGLLSWVNTERVKLEVYLFQDHIVCINVVPGSWVVTKSS